MKKIYALLAMGLGMAAHAQLQPMTNEYGSGNLPAATSGLFKFDDVPVSLYTGVPDVSIPLFSLPTRSKDITIDMSYRYHPSGSAWNISYGGTITRVIENSSSEFKTNESGFANNTRFASDVYKFNFMGHSGSFFLKKEANNTLVPSLLVNKGQDIKIEVDYNPTTYFVNSFTAYDSKGYKFVFGIYDKNIVTTINNPIPRETRVSFRLTAIYDNNGQQLAGITYTEKFEEEPGSGKKEYTNITDQIKSEGFGKLQFVYSPLYGGTKVDEIILTDLKPNTIKSVDFKQLDRLIFRDANKNKIEEYRFIYNNDYSNVSQGIYTTDRFGYPSFIPYFLYEDSYPAQEGYLANAVNPNVINNGVLELIVLPTGGSISYEYEPHTYSFFGGESISKTIYSGGAFQEDPDFYYNYDQYEITFPYNHIVETLHSSLIGSLSTFSLSSPQTVYISVRPEKYYSDLTLTWVYPSVTLTGPGINEPHYRPYNLENMSLGRPFSLNAGLHRINLGPFGGTYSAYRTISTMRKNPDVKKWKYGGGRRIKRIAYFDIPNPNPSSTPVKETFYSYNLFDDPNRSSGNLVASSQMEFADKYGQMEFVTYRNVTVTDSGNNGKTEYTFTSSADYPLDLIDAGDSPSVSKDYKRGLLKNKKAYDRDNALVQNTDYAYLFFDENDQVNYFDDKVVRDRTGKSRIGSETTTYYPANSIPIVQSTQYSYYTDANRSLESKTVSTSAGEALKSKYYYHAGNSVLSKNRISEIEKIEDYKNGSLIATGRTDYGNTWAGNVAWLPKAVAASTASTAPATKAKFNRYDVYGNLLESEQPNGMKTSYVWGYNNTLMVAKIENIAYADIPPALIVDVKLATDGGVEANILQKLDLLRNSPALENAMTATYTYKPLVGVTTVTDPKGNRATYEYDSFGRTKAVKDKNGNVLTENQYNYRP